MEFKYDFRIIKILGHWKTLGQLIIYGGSPPWGTPGRISGMKIGLTIHQEREGRKVNIKKNVEKIIPLKLRKFHAKLG